MHYFTSLLENLEKENFQRRFTQIFDNSDILFNHLEDLGKCNGRFEKDRVKDWLYAAVMHKRNILLVGVDFLGKEERGQDWLADEECFNNDKPLYFSESSHRVSPVYTMKCIKAKLEELVPDNRYSIEILLLCNYEIINEDEMHEVWDRSGVTVFYPLREVPIIEQKNFRKRISVERICTVLQNLEDIPIKQLPLLVEEESLSDFPDENDFSQKQDEGGDDEVLLEEDDFEKLLQEFINSEEEKKQDSENKETADGLSDVLDKQELQDELEGARMEIAYATSGSFLKWYSGGCTFVINDASTFYVRVVTEKPAPHLFNQVLKGTVGLKADGTFIFVGNAYKDDVNDYRSVCLKLDKIEHDCIKETGKKKNCQLVFYSEQDDILMSMDVCLLRLPPVERCFKFRSFQLHRGELADEYCTDENALSCFAREHLNSINVSYKVKNLLDCHFVTCFHVRLFGSLGQLLFDREVEAVFEDDDKEIVLSTRIGVKQNIKWKSGRYLIDISLNDNVMVSAHFDIDDRDIPGLLNEEDISMVIDTEDINDWDENIEKTPLEELQEMVGFDSVKEKINDVCKYLDLIQKRKEIGIPAPTPCLHSAFMGNSGECMLNVVKLFGKILVGYGVLTKGQVIVRERDSLIGSLYSGNLEDTLNAIKEADGGILFIENASNLYRWDDKRDQGLSVLEKLAAAVETQQNWLLILSGKEGPIKEMLYQTPRLLAKIPEQNWYCFSEYSVNEMVELSCRYLKKQHYRLSDEAVVALKSKILFEYNLINPEVGKEIYITNMINNEILQFMASRVSKIPLPSAVQLITIEKEDIPLITQKDSEVAIGRLNQMVGLNELKKNIEQHLNMVKLAKERFNAGIVSKMPPLHMVFCGNPGTGKTTVADFIGEIYASLGLLSRGKVIKVDRKDLVSSFVGETELKTANWLKQAKGDVLFIDEAYTLFVNDGTGKDFGHRVIETLLTTLDKDNIDLLVILAGYPNEMENLLKSNTGLKSRFPYTFCFEDYSVDELMKIAKMLVKKQHFFFTPKAFEALREMVECQYENRDANWGNARYITRLITTQIIPAMSTRLMNLPPEKLKDKRCLQRICRSDILACRKEDVLPDFDDDAIERTLCKLDDMIGLRKVKKSIHDFVTVARYLHKNGESYFKKEPLKWTFVGNTGTGKSSIAAIMGELLKAMHVLDSGHLVELKAESLYNVPEYEVDHIIKDAMKNASEGLLFIDGDAPVFRNPQTRFNSEALRFKLNALMMELPGRYALVIAEQVPYNPYVSNEVPLEPIHEISHLLYFEDYSEEELYGILTTCLQKRKLKMNEESTLHIKNYIDGIYRNNSLGYANARTMSLLAKAITNNYLLRISSENKFYDGLVIRKDVEKFVWKTTLKKKPIGFHV